MQKLCSKLRPLSLLFSPSATTSTATLSLSSPSLNSTSFSNFHQTSPFSLISSQIKSHLINAPFVFSRYGFPSSHFPIFYAQARTFSAKSKEKKWKKLTPATSRVKKIKMKTISAFKGRFRTLKDGTIRRWREGKRHNAHIKSKKSKRRLRKPEIVPLAYAKVMKKMNFCANY